VLVLADESAQLQGLFFGGLPYLVQCAGPSEPLHRAFSEAAPKLVKEGVIPVAVDCGAKMPSGKTIHERFFAGKDMSAEPFFFLVANKDAPRHLAITPNKQVLGLTPGPKPCSTQIPNLYYCYLPDLERENPDPKPLLLLPPRPRKRKPRSQTFTIVTSQT
jgi:hypothetical protein